VAYLSGLAEAAEQRDTSLLLIPVSYGGEEALAPLRNAAVDGFCVYCVPDWLRAMEVLRVRGLPVVTGENPDELWPGAFHVGIDERASAREIGEHVAGLGHRHVAMIGDWVTEPGHTHLVRGVAPDELRYYLSRERISGFHDAFAKAGVAWNDVTLVNAAGNHRAAGAEAAAFALDRSDRCTAILATSDVLALGALDALAVRGLRPGRDVSVTGFDDVPEAAVAGLTTIHQPSAERGRITGELLLDPPREPADRRRILPTDLVVRATTGPVPNDR
jgi:DNA-binding LacI/PurR family transcriptional regulator